MGVDWEVGRGPGDFTQTALGTRRRRVGDAAAGSLLPPSLQQALATGPPTRAGCCAIKHVVILMQENRSFDHYFGSLRGVRGFGDRNAVQLPGGKSVFEQPGSCTPCCPSRCASAAEAQKKDLQYIGDLDHSWSGGAKAWNNGWMDGWISAKTAATHGVLHARGHPAALRTRRHLHRLRRLPLLHPHLHEPQPQPPVERQDRLRGERQRGRSATTRTTRATTPATTGAPTPSGWRRRARSWKTYTEWENFTDNQIEFFTTFKAIARKALAKTGRAERYTFMEAFYAKVRDADDDAERAQAARASGGGRRHPDGRRA